MIPRSLNTSFIRCPICIRRTERSLTDSFVINGSLLPDCAFYTTTGNCRWKWSHPCSRLWHGRRPSPLISKSVCGWHHGRWRSMDSLRCHFHRPSPFAPHRPISSWARRTRGHSIGVVPDILPEHTRRCPSFPSRRSPHRTALPQPPRYLDHRRSCGTAHRVRPVESRTFPSRGGELKVSVSKSNS